jgi:hypothetical protein
MSINVVAFAHQRTQVLSSRLTYIYATILTLLLCIISRTLGVVELIIDVNLYPLLAKAPVISASLVPIHTMDEREAFIVKYLREISNTDARQEVKDIPGVVFREIPMHSLNHLREEFLQL